MLRRFSDKMHPKVSVIIPCYNAEKTIKQCLDYVFNSSYKNFEVIVVDDCSTDSSVKIINKFYCKLIKLGRNCGPAYARNIGAKKAKGQILLFLDSDVLLRNDAIKLVIENFEKDKNISSVVGIYSMEPANRSLFNWYMALKKFSDWTHSKQKYYSSFQTRLGAIKKKIFFEIGGFNEAYKKADTEDYEFGHRLTRKYKVILDSLIEGKHFNPPFKNCFKNYFKRSFQWFRLFIKRKKFDNVTTTASIGVSSGFGFLSQIFLLLFIAFMPFSFLVATLLLVFSLFSMVVFITGNFPFYSIAANKKGALFAVYAFLINYILSFAIGLGAFLSFFSYPIDKLRGKA